MFIIRYDLLTYKLKFYIRFETGDGLWGEVF